MAGGNKIVVSKTKNQQTRIFSVQLRITDYQDTYRRKGEVHPTDWENSGINKSYPLAKPLFEINGIQSVTVDQYDIFITIGRAFRWNDIHSLVLRVINGYLNTQRDIEAAEEKKKNNNKK